jgi:hypothetical protein
MEGLMVEDLELHHRVLIIYLIQVSDRQDSHIQGGFYTDRAQAIACLKGRLKYHQDRSPRFVEWREDNGLTGFDVLPECGPWRQYRLLTIDHHDAMGYYLAEEKAEGDRAKAGILS